MLIEASHPRVLDRANATHAAEKAHSEDLHLLREVIDYGTHLVVRLSAATPRSFSLLIAVGVFLRNILRGMDCVEVLVRAGQVQGAGLSIRSVMETVWSLQWLLQENQDERAKQYYVSHLRREKLWALRVTAGSPENENYVRDFPGDVNPYAEPRMRDLFAGAQTVPAEVDAVLTDDKYRDINERFEKLQVRMKREPQWYQPSGPRSIAELAKRIGRGDEYRGLYESFSNSAHGSRFADALEIRDGAVAIEPIRTIEHGGTILTLALAFGLRSFDQSLQYFRPDEVSSFRGRYRERWRDGVRTIRNAEVVKDTINLDSWAG
jgi:hypothetical protein